MGIGSQFTRIKGLSDKRRFPRVGIVRLGVRVPHDGGDHPKEVPYFVVKEEVEETEKGGVKTKVSKAIADRFHEVYGDKPTALEIIFPSEDELILAPQAYCKYGTGGIVCKGDGNICERLITETGEEKVLPCPTPEECQFALDKKNRVTCKLVTRLSFLLPRVTMSGIWTLETGSVVALEDVNSAFEFVRHVVGRLSMVPLILRREEMKMLFEGKRQTHWICQIRLPETPKVARAIMDRILAVRQQLTLPESVTPRLALAPPNDDIPEDLYPKDVVREAKKALPAPEVTPEPAPEVEADIPIDAPPEDGSDVLLTPEERVAEGLPLTEEERASLEARALPAEPPPATLPPSDKRGPGRPRKAPVPGTAQAAGEGVARLAEQKREAATKAPPHPPVVADQKPAAAKPISLF